MKKPYVICHMLTSLDGKIDGDFFSSLECASALRQFGKVREFYACPATPVSYTHLKFLPLVLSALLILSLAACGEEEAPDDSLSIGDDTEQPVTDMAFLDGMWSVEGMTLSLIHI